MLWEIEIQPRGHDAERDRVAEEYDLLTHGRDGRALVGRAARGYLVKLTRDGQLSLSLAEMRTIQEHFRAADHDPTDVELETLAQTWSEHCSHKTLKGRVEFSGEGGPRRYDNLLKETIFAATQE